MLRPAADPRSPKRKPVDKALLNAKHKAQLKATQTVQPWQKSSFSQWLPAIGGSAIAIAVVLFSLGKMPQVDKAGADLNATLQAHNDVIVSSILHSGPALLMTFGAMLVVGLVWANRPQKGQLNG